MTSWAPQLERSQATIPRAPVQPSGFERPSFQRLHGFNEHTSQKFLKDPHTWGETLPAEPFAKVFHNDYDIL